jgi:competence protein ComEC
LTVVFGVALGVLSPGRPEVAAALAFAAAGLATLVGWAGVRRLAILMALGAGGMTHGALASERALSPALAGWFEARAGMAERLDEAVLLEGALLTDAAVGEGGVQMLMTVVRARDAGGWHRVRGRVQLRVAGALAIDAHHAWRAGRPIRAPVTLRRPRVLFNYGGPSPRLQALRRPFDLGGTVKSAALVEVEPGGWWSEAAASVRARVRRSLAQQLTAGRDDARDVRAAAVATAILIGDRAGLSDEVERRLQEAGTYHVIAISGGNIAVIAAMAFALACALTRSARARSLATLAAVLAYGSIVSPDPSVTRAVVAACVYLAATLAGLIPRPVHVLLVVAAGVAVVDPLSTIDVGAWLSFGATLGILLLTQRLLTWLPGHRSPGWRVVRGMAAMVAASVAAEAVLLPIAAAVFGRLSAAGLLLNVVAVPAMAVLQASGLVVAAAASVWPGAAAIASTVVRLSADALLESARLVDVLPWLSWRVPPTSLAWTVVYYGAGGLALATCFRKWRPAAALVAGIAGLVIVTAPTMSAAKPRDGWIRLTVLDVGQGEAVLAQLPSGHDLLVDTGGGPGSFDVGARVVTPAVWALGSRRLDWLTITHADLDHIGGAAAVVADLDPREIWEGIPVPRDAALQRLLATSRAQGVARRRMRRGDVLEAGGVTIEVCHPPAPEWERQRVRNDDSVVLRLRYGEVEMLLTGDAGPEFEQSWAGSDGAAIRILKAAHHGSRTSSSAAFVEAYSPHAVLVSVGRGNPFGHPAPVVLGRFRDAGAEVFRTDTDGAITVETDGVEARVRTALGRTWTIGVWRRPSP